MKLEPLGDNIIIELDEIKNSKEKVLESGVIIPANTISDQEARQDIATVISVGEGRLLNNGRLVPLRVKEGDRVIFNKFAGTQLLQDDKTYLILKECDILAIIRD
ncbi:MAG: co-chaperone GroES [Romboutsia timonensis]